MRPIKIYCEFHHEIINQKILYDEFLSILKKQKTLYFELTGKSYKGGIICFEEYLKRNYSCPVCNGKLEIMY